MSSDGECSPQKVKLRESRDRSSLSRIRKLKRRISASFMRLSLSREDTIHENDTESDSLRATNGHSSREDSQSPPVFFSLNGTPEHAMYNHGQQADLSNTNGSSSSAGKLDFKGPLGQYKKRSPVKRHHSAGDMLAADISFESVPIRERPSRPKSEGNFYMEGYVPKRASSFGFNSPFGKVDSYQKLEQLGEGSYATVFKGRSNLNSKVVALKEIRLQPEEGAPFTAIREASLLKGLKHSNIVTLHDIIHTKETLTFVFEFVQTDLSQYLEKNTGGLNPHNIKLYLFQLLRGLAYCHCRRILHRDLKPQNLLISEIGELKLADFGLARAKSVPSKTYSHEVVTLWYRPPDVLLGSTDYSTSLDMWGVGCIFTEMISGTATFPGMKDAIDQLERIWRILGTPTEETWEGVTRFPNYGKAKICQYPRQRLCHAIPKLSSIPHAEKLANLFLQMRPEARASAVDSLCHQYFADLPPMIHELPDAASIYNIPGVRLVPERSEVVRPNIRTNIRTNPRAVKV